MTLEGITRAEMCRGCWDPKQRLKDMDAAPREGDLIPEPPSTYHYRQMFCCFFRDKHGVRPDGSGE